MRHILKIILSLVFIIFASTIIGTYYFIRNFDLNNYKHTIEQLVSKSTGRDLKINGNARLGISLIPTLIIDDITLSNASWAQQPYMLKLSSLQIEASILPLLKKELVISEFRLIQPQIYLEKSSNGMPNWNFSKPNKVLSQKQTLGFAQKYSFNNKNIALNNINPLPNYIKQISLKNIIIEDGYIQYYDDQTKNKQALDLNNIALSMESLDSPIITDIKATYQKEPIIAKLKLGSFNDLFIKDSPFSIDAGIKAYNVKALIKGYLFDVLDDIAYDLNINVNSPNNNFNLPLISVDTQAKGNFNQLTAEIKNLQYANNHFSGNVDINLLKSIPNIKATIQSPQVNIQTLQNKKNAYNLSIITTAHASNHLSNAPIPYKVLNQVNGSINLYIKNLIISDEITANNVHLKSILNNGVLNITPLNMDLGGGNISLTSTINANKKTITMNVKGNNILLQKLHKEFSIDGEKDFGIINGGKIFLTSEISSNGDTPQQIIQNAKGQTIAVLSATEMQTGSLHFLSKGIIPQLLNTLKIDTSKTNIINMQCAVARADISNGNIKFPNGIAIQSNKLTLSSDGKINLLNDKIDFSLTPSFNLDTNIAQALGSLIKITGTIEQPKIILDDKNALKTVVGIATTGGVGYLGSQTILSNNSPCYTALEGTTYEKMVPQPSTASKIQQKTITETKQAIKQELKNIEQNAKEIFNFLRGK